MQITIRPLQIVSRLLAGCVVAAGFALIQLELDAYERDMVDKLNHRELIEFVKEVHSSSFLSAYAMSLLQLLLLVVAVEAVALAIRLPIGWLLPKEPDHTRRGRPAAQESDADDLSHGIKLIP
jgi:hypothetical protein